MSLILNLTAQGLINGAIYALIAIGLAMVFGLLRVLHIAHAGMFALGGYLGLVITNATGSFALGLVGSMIAVAVWDRTSPRLRAATAAASSGA